MSKQILRGLTMIALILTVAFVSAVVSANAQNRLRLSAEIPFEFTVGSKTLPAGSYTVRPVTENGEVLVISNRDQNISVLRLSSDTVKKHNTKVCLVFHRYGGQSFLSEMWAGEATGKIFAKSKQQRAIEREMATLAAKTDFASSGYYIVEVVAVLK
jgi:hypothetical protein